MTYGRLYGPFTMTYGQTIWALYNDLRTDYMGPLQ